MRKLLAALALLAFAGGAHADWSDTLKARDLDGNGSVDAYFDTSLNITWLADANYLGTTGQGMPNPFQGPGSVISSFVNGAAIGLIDVFGTTGWRAPETAIGTDCLAWFQSGKARCGETADAADSELVHLGVTLGGNGTGPFFNVQTSERGGLPYLLKVTTDIAFCGGRCEFTSGRLDGAQYTYPENSYGFIWFVHDGDVGVSPIPEPSTYALLLAGLGAIGWTAGRRKVP